MILLIAVVALVVYLYQHMGTAASAPSAITSTPSAYPFQDNLDNFTQAISQFEGGKPGDLNVVNNNPGNIKGGSFARAAIGTDANGFSVFGDVGDGWDALGNYVQANAADNPTWNFYDFFQHYLGQKPGGPTNTNQGNSNTYAQYVANYIGVDPTTPVSSLFGYS